ncbi:hypothetical protein K1T71_013516 [Dendrolimus kikuchii]|uniref:Uncharacterized protein n=1 Tax=Dendrolimus kikuchii TaxID=765133 RepID=A0ACC1CGP8_9NEOP|nr:hypothetical protein K1T71_013516 [Dendrolimus kikuchii]
MAQDGHVVTINENPEVLVLEIIREEQCSPALSSAELGNTATALIHEETEKPCPNPCTSCFEPNEIYKLLKEKEEELKEKFKVQLEKEITKLKDRFDFILQNEQVRASYMLREAHRERQEKITALQTQLECKNLSGLMYVMCSERRKSKLEKLRLIEEYTRYINSLQDILGKSQQLILHLSRGYKTAARVDYEWRQKMIKIVKEFQSFIYHYAGGTPESNQYFFDLPSLLKTKAPIIDDPEEDLCDCEEELEEEAEKEDKPWWEQIEGDCRPFLMFGDMAEFKPPQRRAVLKVVKAAKTAPRKWKNYVFNEMSLKAGCSNLDSIKDEYPKHLPHTPKWECQAAQTDNQTSKALLKDRRLTTQSVDTRGGDMGSILKIMTTSGIIRTPTKTTLLGARDSMEIASTTRLREKVKHSDHSKVVINVGSRKTSLFPDLPDDSREEQPIERKSKTQSPSQDMEEEEEDVPETLSPLGSPHNDSLEVIQGHVPDQDHKINYEKICPMEKCQRMQVDSFIRTLPPYMRASPFMQFEQTYEDYETCSPEQLEILKARIAEKEKKEVREVNIEESPLSEWTPSVEGIAVQTSDMSVSLPPCTCRAPVPSPASSNIRVFNVEDLIPVKEALDEIIEECFYDNRIEFDRFKVIGQERPEKEVMKNTQNFTNSRLQEITKILKNHPSLLDIFQANLR